MLSRVAIGPRWGSAKPSSMVLLLSSTTYGMRRCGAGARRPERRGGGGGGAGARGGGRGGGGGGGGGAGDPGGGRGPPVPAPRTSNAHTGCPSADRRGPGGRPRRAREREGRGGDEHLVAPVIGA